MSNNEDISILQEINEELKHDQQAAFMKKHKNIIFGVVSFVVAGILIHSSWYERKKRNMEDITNTVLSIIQSPGEKSDLKMKKLLEDAPAELRPILTIMKSGKQLILGDFAEKTLNPLLDLSKRHGVDLVWKDLALLIYASYPTKTPPELVKLLKPLTNADRPFRFTALELIGVIHENAGNREKALQCFDKIIADKEAPKTLKERVKMLSSYVQNNLKSLSPKPVSQKPLNPKAINANDQKSLNNKKK